MGGINQRFLSYDGRTGDKQHGEMLPDDLRLVHVEIDAGISTQYTLLGRYARTVESLYLSPALAHIINVREAIVGFMNTQRQFTLF